MILSKVIVYPWKWKWNFTRSLKCSICVLVIWAKMKMTMQWSILFHYDTCSMVILKWKNQNTSLQCNAFALTCPNRVTFLTLFCGQYENEKVISHNLLNKNDYGMLRWCHFYYLFSSFHYYFNIVPSHSPMVEGRAVPESLRSGRETTPCYTETRPPRTSAGLHARWSS